MKAISAPVFCTRTVAALLLFAALSAPSALIPGVNASGSRANSVPCNADADCQKNVLGGGVLRELDSDNWHHQMKCIMNPITNSKLCTEVTHTLRVCDKLQNPQQISAFCRGDEDDDRDDREDLPTTFTCEHSPFVTNSTAKNGNENANVAVCVEYEVAEKSDYVNNDGIVQRAVSSDHGAVINPPQIAVPVTIVTEAPKVDTKKTLSSLALTCIIIGSLVGLFALITVSAVCVLKRSKTQQRQYGDDFAPAMTPSSTQGARGIITKA